MQAWAWCQSKPFTGTLLNSFGHSWPAYGPIEYPCKGLYKWLSSGDTSISFLNPPSGPREDALHETQVWRVLDALLIY